jgi:two-component system nitrogen regulation sensor histidine kinase GlnL
LRVIKFCALMTMEGSPLKQLAAAIAVEALHALAFEHHPAAGLVFGADGALLAANDAAKSLFGRTMGALTRRRLSDALPPDSLLPAMVERAGRDGVTVRERAVDISLPDSAPMEAEAVVTPLMDGVVLLTLTVKAHTAGLELTAGTLRSVAGMGRTLAHEIKNPLAGIRGAAQLLGAGAGNGVEDAALAQLIVDETDRIRRLIDRVEVFAEECAPERRSVNIHRILDRVRALISAGAGDDIVFHEMFDPSLPHAFGDEDQLIQIFLNLVKNAAEAANSRGDGRGDVFISTSFRQGFRTAPLEIKIQDNGPGVPPGLRDRLFDPFITTKAQGAGLGLTLVAKLVASHSGMIDFDSEPGRTTFRVLLPIAPAGAPSSSPP